ncbi:MAG TPA: FAD-dependent oxidoreductase [Flavihumibacter sp.]|jgi:glycine/D-amino acid oxidase-like deaminating enzyme
MNLRSPEPYWLLKNGLISDFPSLGTNQKTDILVMGAGITGALCAWHLVQAGFKVIVCDKRHAGTGSTAASTALLQYEIDTPLRELISKVGELNAVRSYERCAYAIGAVEKICRRYKGKAGFTFRPSIQFASFKNHVPDLEKEYQLRKQYGFNVNWWDSKMFIERIGFEVPGALYSNLGAEVDAFQLTHRLLESCVRKGAKVYDNTAITEINHQKNSVSVLTAQGFKIDAKQLVMASGYEAQRYIPQRIQNMHATYAIISEPMPGQQFWHQNALIWETAQPYLYLRTTKDKRVLIGGLDDDFSAPVKRERMLPSKAKILLDKFHRMFPHIPFKIDFQWSGAFASSKDGLPYIGQIRQRPNTWFALGFGGNGITFSLLAAEQITRSISGGPDPDSDLFRFDR